MEGCFAIRFLSLTHASLPRRLLSPVGAKVARVGIRIFSDKRQVERAPTRRERAEKTFLEEFALD